MLDIHPPERAAHTWRDFFIHIATIVIGLLIAIGLEQTVEAIHHHRELVETREALRQERVQNQKNFAANTAFFRLEAATLKNDMLVLKYLQQHPGAPEETLPGVLIYSDDYEPSLQSAWKTAEQTTVTQWMPRSEVAGLSTLYWALAVNDADSEDLWRAHTKAMAYVSRDPNLSHLTPAQVEQQLTLTQDCIRTAFQCGASLENANQEFPDLQPAPTFAELGSLLGQTRSAEDQRKLSLAHKQTEVRLASETSAAFALAKIADQK
jgi:hypothetical protein